MNHVTRFEEMLDAKLETIPEAERLPFLHKQLKNWELRRDNHVNTIESNPLAPTSPGYFEYTMACCAIQVRITREQVKLREAV